MSSSSEPTTSTSSDDSPPLVAPVPERADSIPFLFPPATPPTPSPPLASGSTSPSSSRSVLASVPETSDLLPPATTHSPQHSPDPSQRQEDDGDAILAAPRPGFANGSRHGRPASYSGSTSSHRGGQVALGGRESPVSMRGRTESSNDVNALAQEELLTESAGPAQDDDPYTWERPLESINRYSRMYDTTPLPVAIVDRRVSRLPPGVSLIDPFGYGLSAESSPYDSALQYGGPPPRSPRTSQSHLSSGYPSSASVSLSSNGYLATSSAATSPVPWTGQEKKRSSSVGDMGTGTRPASARVASGLGGRSFPGMGRSKLSGEIAAEASLDGDLTYVAPPANAVPTEQDYLHSKLYQRTLKAQKALEKERAKAKRSPTPQFEQDLKAVKKGKRLSLLSDAGSQVSTSKRRLGWFRSSSEVALPSPSIATTPTLPTSQSVSQLPFYPPAMHDLSRPSPPAASADRARARQSSNGAPPPPNRFDPPLSPPPTSPLPSSPTTLDGPGNRPQPRTRTSSARSSKTQSGGNQARAAQLAALPPSPQLEENGTGWPHSNGNGNGNGYAAKGLTNGYAAASPPNGYSREPSPIPPPSLPLSLQPGARAQPGARDQPTAPTLPSSAPTHRSLPPGAGAPLSPYSNGSEPARKRKNSFTMLFSSHGGKEDNREQRAREASEELLQGQPQKQHRPTPLDIPPPAVKASSREAGGGGGFFGRGKKGARPATGESTAEASPVQEEAPPTPTTGNKLSKGKAAGFFSTFGRSRSSAPPSSGAEAEPGSKHKALPQPPPSAAGSAEGFGARLRSPRYLVRAGT